MRRISPMMGKPETKSPSSDLTGSLCSYEISAYPSKRGLSVFLKDITERRKMEEALRISEARYRTLFENMPDGLYQSTPDGRLLMVNQVLVETLGYGSKEELLNVDIARDLYVNPDERKTFISRLNEVGKVHNAELVLRRKDGKPVTVIENAHIVRDDKGKVLFYEGTLTDITDRKEMEMELKKYSERLEGMVEERTKELYASEERLRRIIESSPDTIAVIAPDGKITECNQAALTLLKLPAKEELIGRTFLNFVAQKDHKLTLENVAALQSQGHARNFELTLLSKDGREVLAVIDAALLQAKSDSPGSVVAIVKDITQRKMAEAELKKAMAIREQLILNITHELRTPLVSIAGYLSYIALGYMGPVPEAIKGGLEVVRRNTDRLVNLTNDLLDVQRIQAGKIQLELEPLDFREILDQCIKEIAPFVYGKRQTIKMKVQETPLRIQGDRIKLSQVVTNILSNASKFTSEEGEITIQAEEDADAIKVQISDTGIDIREKELKRVFEPFAVIYKPNYAKGTGLGLSVTKGLVEAHGGRIWAESPGEGKGATFIFILPKEARREGADLAK
jgi:PAS domain S-box-containing protein